MHAASDAQRTWLAQRGRQRGVTLVVAMAVILIIASLLLVFARQMQTEAQASRNHVEASQARWIARGVVQAILADLNASVEAGERPTLTLIEEDAGVLGGGAYWIIKPNNDSTSEQSFGLVREAGKLNLNTASVDMLLPLPQMTDEIAAAIVDWRDSDSDITENGAESSYYLAQSGRYNAKNDAFETVDELLLVRDVDSEVLNGVLDASENDAGESYPPDNGDGRLELGVRRYVTVYSNEPTVRVDGSPQVDVNQAPVEEIQDALREALEQARADALATQLLAARPMRNLLEGYLRAGVTEEEAQAIGDRLTTLTGESQVGLVDATAAPATVLDALPGLEVGDGDKLVAARAALADEPHSLLWMVDAIGEQKAVAAADLLTTRNFQFSADIVAVSPGGRAFCRLYVVIDVVPDDGPRVVYAQDLTALGWPLDGQILTQLRQGTPAEDVAEAFGAKTGS